MALKFLNKKGWHTGSLRNIENVWKAEQKHEAEQRKLEELRKQILEERERDEFRQLQEQAGITPRQERLEFLYDSGLAVGKTSSDGFKAIETYPGSDNSASILTSAPASASDSASALAPGPAQSASNQAAVLGALFEDKPQSANDAWRKLHTDPLLMIRQREQEALARIKNNPVKMAMIRKSVESKKKKRDKSHEGERQKVKSKHKKHSSSKHHSDSESDGHEERERNRKVKHKNKDHNSDSENDSDGGRERRKKAKNQRKEQNSDSESDSDDERERRRKAKNKRKEKNSDSESDSDRERERRRKVKSRKEEYLNSDEDSGVRTRHHRHSHRHYETENRKSDRTKDIDQTRRGYEKPKYDEYRSDHRNDKSVSKAIDNVKPHQASDPKHNSLPPRQDSSRHRGRAPQLTEEERAARLREMQMDAEVHEEQRWKRLKKADEDDAREASQAGGNSRGKSFLHSVQKSVYGAEKGGSSTIEESVRRRTHFLQGRTADESKAFRR